MSEALAVAGDNITAASTNNSSPLRAKYILAAKNALRSVDVERLPAIKKGTYEMLRQKLLAIDPISYSQLSGFDSIPYIGNSKLRMGLTSVALGSILIALIGQPTLLHKLFAGSLSSAGQLDVALWDTEIIVRNNLIAMAAVLAGLITWNKVSKFA